MKGVKNHIAYHMSKILENEESKQELFIWDTFPDEQLITLFGMVQEAEHLGMLMR